MGFFKLAFPSYGSIFHRILKYVVADYSDQDVIRIDDDFYMVASGLDRMPGIPVLHSKDLVNRMIIGPVYNRLPYLCGYVYKSI
jgi:hypothetical protein